MSIWDCWVSPIAAAEHDNQWPDGVAVLSSMRSISVGSFTVPAVVLHSAELTCCCTFDWEGTVRMSTG